MSCNSRRKHFFSAITTAPATAPNTSANTGSPAQPHPVVDSQTANLVAFLGGTGQTASLLLEQVYQRAGASSPVPVPVSGEPETAIGTGEAGSTLKRDKADCQALFLEFQKRGVDLPTHKKELTSGEIVPLPEQLTLAKYAEVWRTIRAARAATPLPKLAQALTAKLARTQPRCPRCARFIPASAAASQCERCKMAEAEVEATEAAKPTSGFGPTTQSQSRQTQLSGAIPLNLNLNLASLAQTQPVTTATTDPYPTASDSRAGEQNQNQNQSQDYYAVYEAASDWGVGFSSQTQNQSHTPANSFQNYARKPRIKYDKEGYNRQGVDREGYDREGFDKEGYNRQGYNRQGYDKEGYPANGLDGSGYDRQGYDRYGFDQNGLDRAGYQKGGVDRHGLDRYGYTQQGYNSGGYDRLGYKRSGDYYYTVSTNHSFPTALGDGTANGHYLVDPTTYNSPSPHYPYKYRYHRQVDENGFDQFGYDDKRFDRAGYNLYGRYRDGSHQHPFFSPDANGRYGDGRDKYGCDDTGQDSFGRKRSQLTKRKNLPLEAQLTYRFT